MIGAIAMTSLALAALATGPSRMPFPILMDGETKWVQKIEGEHIVVADEPDSNTYQVFWLFESEEEAGERAVQKIDSMSSDELIEHLGSEVVVDMLKGVCVYIYDTGIESYAKLLDHLRANPELEFAYEQQPGETVEPHEDDIEDFMKMLGESGWDYLEEKLGFEPGFALQVWG